MIRASLLWTAGRCCRALPPEWAAAARSEAEHVEDTAELARWTLGLARVALAPARTWLLLVVLAAGAGYLDLHDDSALTSLALLVCVAAAVGARTRSRA